MTAPNVAPQSPRFSARFAGRVLVKGLLLFAAANLIFALVLPLPSLGRLSAYNRLFPGRLRLPYGDTPSQSYNLNLFNLEAMFAAHVLADRPKPADEYRVLLIGDSATWGFLLRNDQTLAAHLNAAGLRTADGRTLRAYNLGYPVMSLTKDLLLLQYGRRYQPDLIVWLVTLESFPYDKQLFPPLLQNNPQAVRDLAATYALPLELQTLAQPTWLERTIVGQRRPLADLLRLQAYGVLWAATGIDQDIPATWTPAQVDLEADESFHELQPPTLQADDLAFPVLAAGMQLAGDIPVVLVNEPVLISTGENSQVRYNFFYPRWAYDDYRRLLADASAQNGWTLLDFWDLLPPAEFTNSAVHRTPAGEVLFAAQIIAAIQGQIGE